MVKALTNEDFERLIESFNQTKKVQIVDEKPVGNRNDVDKV